MDVPTPLPLQSIGYRVSTLFEEVGFTASDPIRNVSGCRSRSAIIVPIDKCHNLSPDLVPKTTTNPQGEEVGFLKALCGVSHVVRHSVVAAGGGLDHWRIDHIPLPTLQTSTIVITISA
jgi:hypothetical protein